MGDPALHREEVCFICGQGGETVLIPCTRTHSARWHKQCCEIFFISQSIEFLRTQDTIELLVNYDSNAPCPICRNQMPFRFRVLERSRPNPFNPKLIIKAALMFAKCVLTTLSMFFWFIPSIAMIIATTLFVGSDTLPAHDAIVLALITLFSDAFCLHVIQFTGTSHAAFGLSTGVGLLFVVLACLSIRFGLGVPVWVLMTLSLPVRLPVPYWFIWSTQDRSVLCDVEVLDPRLRSAPHPIYHQHQLPVGASNVATVTLPTLPQSYDNN